MRKAVFAKSLALASAVVIAGAVAGMAVGATPIAVDSWQPFFFGSQGSAAIGSPFTFTTSDATVVTVTDAFCPGDRFTVSEGATTLGTTSLVAVDLACSLVVSDPDMALGNPGFSSGRFVVGAGAHSIGIVASTSPFDGGGTAFLRYDILSPSMCKKSGWMAFQPAFKSQGDCVSFVVTAGRNEPAG
jgi:hypothetical protein